jgi:hypothetical protein
MAKRSRWNAEKQYQMKEALSQKESEGQIVRRHQVSEALIYRGGKSFFRGVIRSGPSRTKGKSGDGVTVLSRTSYYRQVRETTTGPILE